MNLKIHIVLFLILTGVFSCNRQWEEHYNVTSETIDQSIWKALQNESEATSFVEELKNFSYDTLLDNETSFTLFVPTNGALEAYKSNNEVDELLLEYLITPHFVQSSNISGLRKIQTLGEKFLLFENTNGNLKIDDVFIISESPLYKNGKYYLLDEVAEVKPNLYEYYAVENPILKNYIDDQDTLILDKARSEPIDFNDNGEIIYDTVANLFNEFEQQFFPVKKEFRYETATIVFPKSEDYNNALTEMAQVMYPGTAQDYQDIPLEWQNRILIPYLLKKGIFENMLEPEEFEWEPFTNTAGMKNILGDSVLINYKPVEKAICSNGYAYNYESFFIPDSLYMNPFVVEAESFLQETGIDKYTWDESVIAKSDMSFIPEKGLDSRASNDSILSLIFPQGYEGSFSVELTIPPQFPRRYILVVATNMNYGGIYDVYVNDKSVGTFDYYDFIINAGYNYSSVTGEVYAPYPNDKSVFNKFDFDVTNLTEYGEVKVKFVYTGPGDVFDNGFIIDYIALEPYNEN